MAESKSENEECEAEGNWWGGWLKTVQEKSGSAWNQMRKDLGEFGTTIQRDTAQAAATTATIIRDQLKVKEEDGENEDVTTTARMKVGFSKLLTGLSQSLTPADGGCTTSDDAVPITRKDPHIFDKARARLHAMQTDPTTYCSDPDGVPEFKEWMDSFNVENFKGEISELLVVNTDVRALYTKLVPAAVSHVEFWGRYFYRVQQLKEDENRRKALKERADMTSSQKFDEEEDLGWGDEDDTWDTVPDAMKNQSGTEKFVVLPEGSENKDPSSSLDQKESSPDQTIYPSSITKDSETVSNNQNPTHLSSPSVDRSNPDKLGESPDRMPEPDIALPVDKDLDRSDPASEPRSSANVTKTIISETETAMPIQPPQVSSPSNQTIQGGSAPSLDTERTVEERSKVNVDNLQLEGLTVDTETKDDESRKGKMARTTEQTSPVDSEGSNRESSSLSDDWEKDFDDIEVTEEDLKNASVRMASGKVDQDDLDEDWESWD